MFCPKCGMMLIDSEQSTSWIHCIVFHYEYFEKLVEGLSKEQIVDTLCIIARRFYFDEN
jgi:hypothetical protein